MAQQDISGSFPGAHSLVVTQPVTLVDNLPSVTGGWSGGATNLVPVAIQPPIAQRWQIVAWSLTFIGVITPAFVNVPLSGKLGRLIAGVFPGSQRTGNVAQPFVNPMLPLPIEVSSLATLWDGASDPAFPLLSAGATLTPSPLAVTEVLPTALWIDSGSNLSIGIWLTPSLGGATQIAVIDARYTVTYDDGKPTSTGWGP